MPIRHLFLHKHTATDLSLPVVLLLLLLTTVFSFTRAKAKLYDSGTLMPLAIRYPAGGVKGGRISRDFVSFTDFAPTFLEAAGLKHPDVMTGRSLLGLLRGEKVSGRDHVFVERERHAPGVRAGNLSYPAREVRTEKFLYIRNIHPERYPAGDPPNFGDIDSGAGARISSPTKDLLLAQRDEAHVSKYFHLATDKRPAEELYDLTRDPHQMVNVAGESRYAKAQNRLSMMLDKWMKKTSDPRALGNDDRWDNYPAYTRGRGEGN